MTGLLSDVEARAHRRLTRTRADLLNDLATAAWRTAMAETDPAPNRRWLERAHRLAPRDDTVAMALAGALLRDGAAADAMPLFQSQAARHGAVEALAGLAASAYLAGDHTVALDALHRALQANTPTPTLRNLIATLGPAQGWCGLTTAGELHAEKAVHAHLDGVPVPLVWRNGAARLPPAWTRGRQLHVEGPAGPLLGSPLALPAFAGVEGFVEAKGGALQGWAWHRADPGRPPSLRVEGRLGARVLRLAGLAETVRLPNPLVRPFRFTLAAAEAEALGEALRVTGPDGRDLLGSPLDPGLEMRGGMVPAWADTIAPRPPASPTVRDVDVVVPVYRGLDMTVACLQSVLASLPTRSRLIIIDDCSPEPGLPQALDTLARRRNVTLLRHAANRGFPAAANAGIAATPGRDVVLLNSDTLVPPGWLDRLRAAAYGSDDIGTATPLTNDGTIVSVPDPQGNPMPDLAGTAASDETAQRANGSAVVDIPVGVGFCLYLRRDCLEDVGPLREDVFAQGYGEENDFCLRARRKGWRSVAALGVFVAHAGATSFGTARAHLIQRNSAILERLHPGYGALIAAHVAADPLLPARRRIDRRRWAKGRLPAGAVVLVTHGGGGGVDRVIADRAQAAAARGQRAIIVRPAPGGVRVEDAAGLALPNPIPLPALAPLLRPDRVRQVELHHLLGHDHAIAGLAGELGADAVSVVHDFARFCPRIALISVGRRYCGEPDVAGCEACVADLGSLLEDDPPVPELLARSGAELAGAGRVIVPSPDTGRRITRHFPGIRPDIVPWEDDAALPPLEPVAPGTVARVVVVGAIGTEKGYDVLLGCVRDAAARALPLEFVVVGFTADDERMMAAGPVFITGEYSDDEAAGLIRAQSAHVALIPSVFPETWCFALTRAWQSGLAAVVFDLGAQAERVRATGRGWVLPLALSPGGVNDTLLRLAQASAPCKVPPC